MAIVQACFALIVAQTHSSTNAPGWNLRSETDEVVSDAVPGPFVVLVHCYTIVLGLKLLTVDRLTSFQIAEVRSLDHHPVSDLGLSIPRGQKAHQGLGKVAEIVVKKVPTVAIDRIAQAPVPKMAF